MTDASSRSVDRLRDIAACVTHGRLVAHGLEDGGTRLAFVRPAPVRAPRPLRGASIDLRMSPGNDGGVMSYAFELAGPAGAELLAWHWHPTPEFPAPTFPHVHVSASLRIAGPGGERGLIPLDKRHLPTGLVSFAAFAGMLIEEFGVEPLARDWQARLAEG